jgi:hypothetical protein
MPQKENGRQNGDPIPNVVLADNSEFNAELDGPFNIVERDDGKWALGWHDDAAGPFESRAFALAVSGYVSPAPVSVAKFRRFKIIREVRDVASS